MSWLARRDPDDLFEATTVKRSVIWGGVVLLLVAVVGLWAYIRYAGSGSQALANVMDGMGLGTPLTRLQQTNEYPEPPVEHDRSAAELAALRAELAALKASMVNRPPVVTPPAPAKEKPKPPVWPQTIALVRDRSKDQPDGPRPLTLDAGTFIPAQLETVLNSEIEGLFTVKTKRDMHDSSTRKHVLIPAGTRIVAKDTTAELLYGNERIPTFALSFTKAGQEVELGNAPIVDGVGVNGLTGRVDNHTWRLVWTSIFIGGLQGGQQVLQQQLGRDGLGPLAGGIGQEGSQAARRRLGRAQDTRPTIHVSVGEPLNILLPKALSLAPTTVASR